MTFSDFAPLLRIAIRIGGGALVGHGYADEDTVNLFYSEEVIGCIVLLFNEVWYLIAKKKGWAL